MFSNADTTEEILRLLGQRLAENRKSLRLTQQELAARAGVSKRSLERLEGGTSNPCLDVFVRVCSALGLVEGFERLLPPVELGPLALANGERLPKRVRKGRRNVKSLWKDDE